MGKRMAACIFAWSALAGTAPAGLAWQEKSQHLTPGVADTAVAARYAFHNAGATTVTIQRIATTCGCTTAIASKPSIAPGEQGEILATYSIEDRTGVHGVEIQVETDDPTARVVTLKLKLTIPKIAVIEPDLLRWLPGEEPSPKRLRLRPAPGVDLGTLKVEPSDPGITAKIEPGPSGVFEIIVTPGDRSSAGQLKILTGYPKDHPKALMVPVQVAR